MLKTRLIGDLTLKTAIWCLIIGKLAVSPCYAVDNDHIAILTIMGESANQSLEGQTAVGEVIRNRMKARGQTAERVCLAPKQFSFWNDRPAAWTWVAKNGTGEAYQRASRAWETSEGSNSVLGANLYHAVSVRPSWAKSPKVEFVKQIGAHRFYKETR